MSSPMVDLLYKLNKVVIELVHPFAYYLILFKLQHCEAIFIDLNREIYKQKTIYFV